MYVLPLLSNLQQEFCVRAPMWISIDIQRFVEKHGLHFGYLVALMEATITMITENKKKTTDIKLYRQFIFTLVI